MQGRACISCHLLHNPLTPFPFPLLTHVLRPPGQVFIPLTRLCRDSCGYCTFAQPPKPGARAYMTLEEVLQVAQMGAEQGCTEVLFTLGEECGVGCYSSMGCQGIGPGRGAGALEEVLQVAQMGAEQGCMEVLFTLGGCC